MQFLTTPQCKRCEQRDADATKPVKNKENLATTNTRKLKHSSSIIEIPDSDSGKLSDDEDIKEMSTTDMEMMRLKLAQNKKASSSLRLNPKIKEEGSSRTATFLKMRETARKKGADASKTATILFKIILSLQKPTGKKEGTCVPPQSRSFSLDDSMEHVFRAMVNTFQEAEGRWAKVYPGKSFTREDVHFTFANGSDIPPAFMGSRTIAAFWTEFTKQEGQYFKKGGIASYVAEIMMLVPIAVTFDVVSSDSDTPDHDAFDDILDGRKRRKSRKNPVKPSRSSKRLKIKAEVSDSDLFARVKSEPKELNVTMPDTLRKSLAPKFRLTSAVTFTKEYVGDSLDHPQTSGSQLFHGFRDVISKFTSALGNHFQHYLARRLESDGFRFNVHLEREAALAELNRGQQLKDLLDTLTAKYGASNSKNLWCVLNLHSLSPTIPLKEVKELESDFLAALSHYSLVQSGESVLFAKFKVASDSPDATSIFAPITHSRAGDSGMEDGRPEAIALFKAEHTCNDICREFELAAL
ncbi:hypothetical protein R3P38DRAFT_2786481 [Favolaschia claudopus]|uniref:Alpha-type protein kinase domain-containing protein n=1 Tax=Favolaschia claudopus TaxID=2862362 RepID=A0AAW0ART5_9AGAR